MITLPLKYWLKERRTEWRVACRNAALRQRWPTLQVTEPVSWVCDRLDALHFGDSVHVGPFCDIYVQKDSADSRVPGGLRIGSRTWIGSSCNIRAAGGTITIGDDCLIAQHVSLIASNHNLQKGGIYIRLGWDESKTGVRVGNNVWLGANATVLPGCEIGDGAVIGAGSVVTKSVPPGTVWVGNPARQIREL